MGSFDINFSPLTLGNVSGPSVNTSSVDGEVKVFNGVSNPIASTPITDADLAEMWIDAGVEPISPSEAPIAASTTKAYAAVEGAGFDLVDLDETFANEPDVVAHTLDAFSNGSAARIERKNQSVATLIENLPEGTTELEFEAFMYAFNDRAVA